MSYIKLSRIEGLVWNVNEVNENEVFETKYFLTNSIDKKKEIELIINRIDFRYHKHFIIFGLKYIELIKQIYKHKTPYSSIIIIEIIEENSNEICFEGIEKDLFFLSDKTVSLILGCDQEIGRQLDVAFSDSLKLYNLRNIEVITMPYVKSKYPKQLNNVLDVIFQKLRSAIVSYGNDVEDILIGMDNYINNWKHVFRGVDCKFFKDVYKGKPAIIVGAGPSLDKNIDALKSIKDKAVICSVDGAINTLLNNGIYPNVVSSLERVELTAKFYENKSIPEDIIYVGPNVVLGSILDKFSRIIFTGRYGDALFRELNDNLGFTNLDVGINVSNVLISFARHMGCFPIIFVGMDLAYTNGKTHTTSFSENFDDKFMSSYKKNTVYVKGQNGEMLESFEHFMHTKSWIESKIASDKEGLYINATEGGANIAGAENKSLIDTILAYCVEDKLLKITEIYDKIIDENVLDQNCITEKAINFFEDLTEFYNKIVKETEISYDTLNNYNRLGKLELHEKLRLSLDSTLNENFAGRFIIQSIIINYKRDLQSFPMALDKNNEGLLYKKSLLYFETLSAVSNKVKENIELYKQVLKSHITK